MYLSLTRAVMTLHLLRDLINLFITKIHFIIVFLSNPLCLPASECH